MWLSERALTNLTGVQAFTCVIGQVRELQVHWREVAGASVDVVAEQMHADTPDRCTGVHLCDWTGKRTAGTSV